MTTNNLKQSYEETPYISKTYKTAMPQTQKAVMTLLGFETAELENARILEIGCSFGANLFSYAMAFPNSHCVGIDLSETQINEGKRIAQHLGLQNISLYAKDILEYNYEFGKFDFIICHGVFSWVPKMVQDSILETIKNSLSPKGTALISYNTYPGWKRIDIVKDIMNFRIKFLREYDEPIDNSNIVNYAVGAMDFLANNYQGKSCDKEFFQKELEILKNKDPYYIKHEHLEEYNQALYLTEFERKLKEHQLSYLFDTEINRSIPIINDEIKEALNRECGDNYILKEQFYDYMFNRQFRSSIVSHQENRDLVAISENIQYKNLDNIYIRGLPESDDIISSALRTHYPELIRVSELYKELDEKNNITPSDFYYYIFNALYSGNIEYSGCYYDIKRADKNKKPKLKRQYLDYLKYCLETQKVVIQCGDFFGYILNFNTAELIVLQLFDGSRTLEEIEDFVFNEVSSNESDRKLKIDDSSLDYRETSKEFVHNLYQLTINRALIE